MLNAVPSAMRCALFTSLLLVLPTATYSAIQPATTIEARQAESSRANALFDDIFDRAVARDPVRQTYLVIKTDYDKWNDISEAAHTREMHHARADLAQLATINIGLLDADTRLSYRLMERELSEKIEDYRWRRHNYPVNQMFGEHSSIPAFLINQHAIANEDDAKAYISRLNGVSARMDQLIEQLETRRKLGVIAPDFVLPHVLRTSRNLLRGAPFEDGEPSALWDDFQRKAAALEISDAQYKALVREAEKAMLESVQPAYQSLIVYLEDLQRETTADAGAWKLPDGEDYYAHQLKRMTTTDMTARQIHETGLREVARIHGEMREIAKRVGFEGDLQAFMEYMRTEERFYLPDTDSGRAEYLERVRLVLAEMESRLEEIFITQPRASMIVKRVEPFRERSAGKAFYQQPSPDSSRPGTYYANLYDMSMMPTYQLEALAYHEGSPGHHMQIAIKQELQGLPKFRRFGGVTAYSEGWALYAELLPREMGLYKDPYSDFGRLSMELWRAARLVVDTGMHAFKWTREESIAYYVNNTPNAKVDAVKMVERHAVMPGQATAYKIGMLRILDLREAARNALGEDFDIRQFHEVVLGSGPVPLDILEEQVMHYIETEQASKAAVASNKDRG